MPSHEIRIRDFAPGAALLRIRDVCQPPTALSNPHASGEEQHEALISRLVIVQEAAGDVFLAAAGVIPISPATFSLWNADMLMRHLDNMCHRLHAYAHDAVVADLRPDLIGRALRATGQSPERAGFALRSASVVAFISNMCEVRGPVVVFDPVVLGDQIRRSYEQAQDPVAMAALELHFRQQAEAALAEGEWHLWKRRAEEDNEPSAKRKR